MDVARQLIAAMHADPEVAGEVRRAVLTDELLGLPARITGVEERLDGVEQALVSLAAAQARTEEEVRRLAEAQVRADARLDQFVAEMSELREMFGRFMVITSQSLERIEGKLDEHGRKLDGHGRKLDEHGRKLDEHGIRLARIEERLD